MQTIDRKAAITIVKSALSEVADFSKDDIEGFTFAQFQPFHKKVFLSTLKTKVNQAECSDQYNIITKKEYFDIDLSEGLLNNWAEIKDCIDYVEKKHTRGRSKTEKINLI